MTDMDAVCLWVLLGRSVFLVKVYEYVAITTFFLDFSFYRIPVMFSSTLRIHPSQTIPEATVTRRETRTGEARYKRPDRVRPAKITLTW